MSTRTCQSCSTLLDDDVKFCPNCGTPYKAKPVEPEPLPAAATIPSAGRVVKNPMSRKAKLIYGFAGTALFVLYLYVYFFNLPGKPNPIIEKQPEVAMLAAYAGEPI